MDATAGLQLMGRSVTLSWYGPDGEVRQQVTVNAVECAKGAVTQLQVLPVVAAAPAA